jgi:putative restriction endonuclease
VNIYVGITDYNWFLYLSSLQSVEEVNFWQPGGRTNFRALQRGELFLFKLHAPRNFIVGGGIFDRADILPTSLAWDTFGTANGASSIQEMRQRIAFYRRIPDHPTQDYMIGCRVLTQPFFFSEEQWIPIPESWARGIQQGRRYGTGEDDGRNLWEAVMRRLAQHPGAPISVPRYGEPTLIRPRLGQGAFRLNVMLEYQRRCAVTGEKIWRVLEAAHIRPYAQGGEHEVTNGLLLRTDIHRLFDLGYVTVTDTGRLEVGRRLKEDFENGRDYYAMHGRELAGPAKPNLRPSRAAIEWHQTKRFLG